MVRESPFKGKTGLQRVWRAFHYSLDGFREAYKCEDAFRQEALLAAILIPLSFFLPVSGIGRALMIASVLLVLIVELVNSAIEATVDRVSLAEMGTVDILGVGRGAVVPEDNPYAFALAVADLLRDPARRHALSEDGRTYAAEWSDTALAGRMAELYRDIIRAHARRQVPDFSFSPL